MSLASTIGRPIRGRNSICGAFHARCEKHWQKVLANLSFIKIPLGREESEKNPPNSTVVA